MLHIIMPYKQIEITVKYRGSRNSAPPPHIADSLIAAKITRQISDHNTILWKESAFILCLNSNNKLLGWNSLAIGGMGSINIDIRIIATIALKTIATAIILIHNHPCGNLLPSYRDVQVTRRLKRALDLIDIKLQDHIIISDNDHFSMKEACLF